MSKAKIVKDLELYAEDVDIMARQDFIYKTIEMFLKSDEAIKSRIVGIDVKLEEGYVNASWKFGDRKKGDIKDE